MSRNRTAAGPELDSGHGPSAMCGAKQPDSYCTPAGSGVQSVGIREVLETILREELLTEAVRSAELQSRVRKLDVLGAAARDGDRRLHGLRIPYRGL